MSYSYKRFNGPQPEYERFAVYDDSKWTPECVATFYDEGRAARYVREENEKLKNERR